MSFSLAVLKGPGAGQTLRFDQPEVTFGRVADNDVVLHDSDVSRRHFCISLENGRYVLQDLRSSNGTRVNGEPVEKHFLADGDEVQAGKIVFEYRAGQAASAGASGSASDARASAGQSARERFKQRELASTPIGRLKLRYGAMPGPRKRLLQVGGGVGVLMVFLVAFSVFQGEEGLLGVRDNSGEVFRYERRMSEWRFGYGAPELTMQATDNLGFSFHYLDGRVTLTFDAGFIEGDSEVEIRLNEERLLGYAPLAINTWVRDNQIVLPLDALRPNALNTIVFDQVRNPGASPPATWALENLHISEDAIPEADPIRADERFQLAERRWRNRAISPRNVYTACLHYSEARDYLERMTVKPPLYDEVVARLRECTEQLDDIYRRLVFEAQRYEQFRDWDRVRGTLHQLLEYFPDETDQRNRTVQQWLRQYN